MKRGLLIFFLLIIMILTMLSGTTMVVFADSNIVGKNVAHITYANLEAEHDSIEGRGVPFDDPLFLTWLNSCWLVYDVDNNGNKTVSGFFGNHTDCFINYKNNCIESNITYDAVDDCYYSNGAWDIDGYWPDIDEPSLKDKIYFRKETWTENEENPHIETWCVDKIEDINDCTIATTSLHGKTKCFAAITDAALVEFKSYSINDWRKFDFSRLKGKKDKHVINCTIRENQYYYVGQKINMDSGMVKATFQSSNPDIVFIDDVGTAMAKKPGKATITAVDKGVFWTFNFTVLKPKNKLIPLKKLQCYKRYKERMTTTQFKKAYNEARKISRHFVDCSKKEKINGVAAEIANMYIKGKYTQKAKHYADPYGFFVKRKYTCAGEVRATILCLNTLGIKCKHVNENKQTHQWATCIVNGEKWIVDAAGLGICVGKASQAPSLYRR